ncbi:hypothetical protein COCVIDRAFT_91413 [Bipolaris victoriae FI3]|uniref:Uncharacterized protein n=1 Tax=Bipolaris victoriae (strain FI3) TaxID=930091 RepID=W7EPW7_BIPV3|nr:hypothetical protein COCVIDRAFT_91413 [Bipolaris victoriae FI3]
MRRIISTIICGALRSPTSALRLQSRYRSALRQISCRGRGRRLRLQYDDGIVAATRVLRRRTHHQIHGRRLLELLSQQLDATRAASEERVQIPSL